MVPEAAMPSPLSRVLRVRALQEELARMELEAEAARLLEIEQNAAEAASEARSSRERWFAMVEGEHGGQAANLHREHEDAAWRLGHPSTDRSDDCDHELNVRCALLHGGSPLVTRCNLASLSPRGGERMRPGP